MMIHGLFLASEDSNVVDAENGTSLALLGNKSKFTSLHFIFCVNTFILAPV